MEVEDGSTILGAALKSNVYIPTLSYLPEVQAVTADLYTLGRGFESRVEPAFGRDINNVACTNCGQCSMVCPVGAITEKE